MMYQITLIINWLVENVYAFVRVGMQSSSLKLFANLDQKPMLLKRQAFAMFSGELDQYHLYLPLIQGMVLAIYVVFFCSFVQDIGSNRHSNWLCSYSLKTYLSLLFRASYWNFAYEPQCCCFSANLPDVSCSPVADFVPTPHISLANHGHRAGMQVLTL